MKLKYIILASKNQGAGNKKAEKARGTGT